MDSMEFKLNELLKEVQLDYSPQFVKLVNDTVSSIKSSIDKIPKDYKVILLSIFFHYFSFWNIQQLLC
jgi:U3 small nucleolar RNA-associated protein 22